LSVLILYEKIIKSSTSFAITKVSNSEAQFPKTRFDQLL
jgi:hypothetical protein